MSKSKEAEKITRGLIFQRELAGDLIRTSVKIVDDREEAADARLDLQMIAKALAGATKPGFQKCGMAGLSAPLCRRPKP